MPSLLARFASAAAVLLSFHSLHAFQTHPSAHSSRLTTRRLGWLDNFLPSTTMDSDESDQERRRQYPEQYPASYELLSSFQLASDSTEIATTIRPLLLHTQLEQRPLLLAYDANQHGWSAESFHDRVDGKGAAIAIATTTRNNTMLTTIVGGYNPKGWASMGGARPSVAAFLFHQQTSGTFEKLQKVGGGGLACARDGPDHGISFGPDALVIALQPGQERLASSKLGPYYERGEDGRNSLFALESSNNQAQLDSLKVYVGKYEPGEDIPYSGAVMDMTSG